MVLLACIYDTIVEVTNPKAVERSGVVGASAFWQVHLQAPADTIVDMDVALQGLRFGLFDRVQRHAKLDRVVTLLSGNGGRLRLKLAGRFGRCRHYQWRRQPWDLLQGQVASLNQ